MYKRESLERLLSLTPKKQKPDRAVMCAACGAEVCRRSDETQKDKAHVHRQTYAGAYVSVSVYANASLSLAETPTAAASPPTPALTLELTPENHTPAVTRT